MENRKLIANEGKILTNGKVYGRIIYLGKNATAENFYEITEEEYEAIQEREVENDVLANQIFSGGGNNDHEVM